MGAFRPLYNVVEPRTRDDAVLPIMEIWSPEKVTFLLNAADLLDLWATELAEDGAMIRDKVNFVKLCLS
jgi:hypothetical protein